VSEFTAKIQRLQAVAQAFWQERTEQERRMLSIGGAVVGLGLFYGVLIDPALEGRARLRAQLPQRRLEAAELQALSRTAMELKSRTPIQSPRMTADTLNASLSASGLKASSVVITGDYAKVELKGVPFAQVATWLDTQRRTAAIAVYDANITGTSTPGMVDANFTLQQRGAGAAQ
jgi:general secretion pathway protein M